MKIAILTNEAMAIRQTGDWMQAKKTSAALKSIGVDVKHYVYGDHQQSLDLPDEVIHISYHDIPKKVDVLHFISAPSTKQINNILSLSKKNIPLLAGSTIFWKSIIHHKTVYSNGGSLKPFLKAATIDLLANFTRPINHFERYDLLLPNSEAELTQLRKYCRLKPSAKLIPVPNAIDPVPEWAFKCNPPIGMEKYGYFVYPGVFTPRKNQMGFIKALKNTDIQVVFMGGILGDITSRNYYSLCRKMAPKNWLFLGHVEHRSPEFYGTLANARVACLASSCETPGIALLEAAAVGARPMVTREGGTPEYYGFEAEYLNPLDFRSISNAARKVWNRGRLSALASKSLSRYTWEDTAKLTCLAYEDALKDRN